jgi:hypothetical protein
MTTTEEPPYQDLLESMASEISMPSSFVEQRPSAVIAAKYKAASLPASSDENMNRMLQDLIRLQQQNRQLLQSPPAHHLQPLLSASISSKNNAASMLRDILQTKKQSNANVNANVAFHNDGAAKQSMFNRPSIVEATHTNAIEQEPAAAPAPDSFLRVPCRARGMPKDHVFKVSYICGVLLFQGETCLLFFLFLTSPPSYLYFSYRTLRLLTFKFQTRSNTESSSFARFLPVVPRESSFAFVLTAVFQ